MNWIGIPDLTAVALLVCAFASVARRSPTPVSGIWLLGWITIALHFAASTFTQLPGIWGSFAQFIALASLTWAGFLFMWSTIPYNREVSSLWMLLSLSVSNTAYIAIVVGGWAWAMNPAAVLIGALPLLITLSVLSRFNHPLRWVAVGLYGALSIFLLLEQHRGDQGLDYALNAVLFTVYFACCIHYCVRYRRATTGAFITMAGFLSWAAVFLVAPILESFPKIQVEKEVWNLPKFVVAVGMILILLEDEIEHNKHLALHDHLTGLPNRRLFQDRLASALERARRTDSQTALLVVDLDHFKRVNDTFGHHVGDLLLERVGAIFQARVRRSDTVARTGGDEFSVILEEPISRTDAERVSASLIELLKRPLNLAGNLVHIGASVGVAVFPDDAADLEALCVAADLDMYEHKNEARAGSSPVLNASSPK